MNYPANPTEFRCMSLKLIRAGSFDYYAMSTANLEEALEEVVGAMVDNFVNGKQPSGSVAVMGQMFTQALVGFCEGDFDRYDLVDPGYSDL